MGEQEEGVEETLPTMYLPVDVPVPGRNAITQVVWAERPEGPDRMRLLVLVEGRRHEAERARELGLRRYNMWGTATGSLAHYKEGFGAREESYVGTRALAISPAMLEMLMIDPLPCSSICRPAA